MRAWVIVALMATLLAGCSGKDTPDDVAATGPEPIFDVKATATTGVIRGIVVDDRIVPVGQATVTLAGAGVEGEDTTDVEGRFAFDDLQPGTYFLSVSSLLHDGTQTSVDVVAGVDEPPLVRVQVVRRFAQEPFTQAYKHDGFIQCNQAGILYATAPCITDFTGQVSGPLNGTGPCTRAGCAPQLRQVQQEQRGFHNAVDAGWQSLIWEMSWEETSDTFSRMGLTVSYNVTQRPASHNYLSYGSTSPLWVRLDVGVDHDSSASVEPELLAPEGRPDVYYFVGVRQDGAAPALALNQKFALFAHFFYYGIPPEDWSFIAGDAPPF